jgi:hypothetical protein
MNDLNARIGKQRPANTRPTQKQIDKMNMKGLITGLILSCCIGAIGGVLFVAYLWGVI